MHRVLVAPDGPHVSRHLQGLPAALCGAIRVHVQSPSREPLESHPGCAPDRLPGGHIQCRRFAGLRADGSIRGGMPCGWLNRYLPPRSGCLFGVSCATKPSFRAPGKASGSPEYLFDPFRFTTCYTMLDMSDSSIVSTPLPFCPRIALYPVMCHCQTKSPRVYKGSFLLPASLAHRAAYPYMYYLSIWNSTIYYLAIDILHIV
jgi:hypothetical protein